MELHLDQEELDLIAQLLHEAQGNLRMEIYDTDNSDFKDLLRSRKAILERLVQRIDAVGAGT
ncbi:MAG: hypothetical protein EPO16_09200 [Dehalococcoidia bacterium]|nr:MAG: hypothetical protein EPO16_09200 [Dehalococcoidia bacterium]